MSQGSVEALGFPLHRGLGVSVSGEAESIDVSAVVVRRSEVPSSNGAKRFELALFFTEIEDEMKESLRRYLRR